jgi:hypothetical protein
MNRLDHRRAWLIAGVYLIVAFVWLGSFKSPQTGWVPQKKGDSFVVDFGRPVTIDRTLLFGGLGPVWGCFGSLKMDAWQNGAYEPFTVVDMEALFRWHNSTDTVTTDRLRITTQAQLPKKDGTAPNYWQAEYRELAFFSGKERITGFTVSEVPGAPGISALFDEQELVPYRPNVLHSTYFDEVYFPRTALEQLLDWPVIYENTHPPLGKDIMQVGIAIMGMTPFGWRWLGTLTGALMLPLMYAMAKRLFKDSYWATFCTLFLAADFMHFVQTRIGTVDSYLVLFIMAPYHFMLVYLDEPAEKGLLALPRTAGALRTLSGAGWRGEVDWLFRRVRTGLPVLCLPGHRRHRPRTACGGTTPAAAGRAPRKTPLVSPVCPAHLPGLRGAVHRGAGHRLHAELCAGAEERRHQDLPQVGHRLPAPHVQLPQGRHRPPSLLRLLV